MNKALKTEDKKQILHDNNKNNNNNINIKQRNQHSTTQ